MKEKTLLAYLPKKYTYKIGKDLCVTIDITKNPYHIPMESLFLMAARRNKKRGFLFVSKLLGKHIPVFPHASLLTGEVLAREYMKEVYGENTFVTQEMIKGLIHQEHSKSIYERTKEVSMELPEPTIFIGFAETATALGHAVFDAFSKNATYIHTTRENIINFDSVICFEEEHSHATTHRFYPLDKKLLSSKAPVVLVDDEITTGKTAVNMIKAIQKAYPRKEYAIVSILDWRTKEDQKRYEELEESLGIKVHTISLIKGSIQVEGDSIKENMFNKKMIKNNIKSEIHIYGLQEKEAYFQSLLFSSQNTLGQINTCPYLKETARFGITSKDRDTIHDACKRIGNILAKKRKGKNTLCLGTGEFMYIPMKIAAYMGEGVKYHSSTRSPIHPYDQDGYGAKNAFSFESFDDPSIMNYLYNIPYGYYDDLFLFLEREVEKERLNSLIKVLNQLGIAYITIVICSKEYAFNPSLMGSYDKKDVTFLLKDLSKVMEERGTKEREEAIQKGVHYSEMLPIEYKPSLAYMDLFYASLKESAKKLAIAVGVTAEKIRKNRGDNIVIASLARAGTPIGILIKRYMAYKHHLNVPHYSISIIRGKGIDENAIKYLLKNHPNKEIQFVDGWTGKGAITKVLQKACKDFQEKYGIVLNDDLAVLADPGYCVSTFGTREDFLIASACLNATVSGLVSRTVHRKDLIGPNDFHGAKYYEALEAEDVSKFFIDTITKEFPNVQNEIYKQVNQTKEATYPTWAGLKDIEKIQKEFKIEDINLIKPGIGETTRVLLRRVPWKILVKEKENPNLKHILLLAKEKSVPVKIYSNMTYTCCGLIKPLKGK